jgi:LuxR family transcriptional regulator, maltose regulon positive regulatory protein
VTGEERATATDVMPAPSFPARPGNAGQVARPALFDLLERAARITLVSAAAGSGKTVLLRSWIEQRGLEGRAAWVSVERNECDAQKFWTDVVNALRGTDAGSKLLRTPEPAPSLEGWTVLERLLKDLAALDERLWLVVNDLHELRSDEALRQFELLLLRAPESLRFMVLTRHDLPSGLHRLRLSGDLSEIREGELRFSREEARLLFQAAGIQVSPTVLALLVERTEGWVAGLRLAALSMARHSDPERFAADFSGSERTVAEYLLAEVLDHQPEAVKRLLLRTSVLERVSGPLADVLTGGESGERMLQDLEDANAFVVSLDQARTWFRYHQLFADLLRLELRRTAATEVPVLHAMAAEWYAAHGEPIEAIRHAQAAGNWSLASRVLSDHHLALQFDGHGATEHEFLRRFPPSAVAADAELAALLAADELERGSLEAAGHYLALATRTEISVPGDRTARFQVLLAITRLALARQQSDLPAVALETQKLFAVSAGHVDHLRLGEDLRALALISLGVAETNVGRDIDAEEHLERGIALAQRIKRPYLELYGLAFSAPTRYHHRATGTRRSHHEAVDRALQAIELARRHGWSEEPVVTRAYLIVAVVRCWQARWQEAEEWQGLASHSLRAEVDPRTSVAFYLIQGELALFRGRYAEAVATLESCERMARLHAKAAPREIALTRPVLLLAFLKLGEVKRVEEALATPMDEEALIGGGLMRLPLAALRLGKGDPQAASSALVPLLNRTAPVAHRNFLILAFLLEAFARNALGDPAASECALENALDLAELDGILSPFLLYPAADLLQRHRGRRTAHAALISEILDRLSQAKDERAGAPRATLQEPLRKSELRVLRYLPTNLSAAEIAAELHLSVYTVKTHMRQLYVKFGVHGRSAAVKRARHLGLLAPSSRAT